MMDRIEVEMEHVYEVCKHEGKEHEKIEKEKENKYRCTKMCAHTVSIVTIFTLLALVIAKGSFFIIKDSERMDKIMAEIAEILNKYKSLAAEVITVIANSSNFVQNVEKNWLCYSTSCYYFGFEKFNWSTARADCEAMNSHLIVIESKAENDFVKHELAKLHPGTEDQFWTAGNDLETESKWVWGNTTDPFEVSFWYPGEPNQSGGEEDCLAYYTRHHFAWNDEHCNNPMPYICEIEDYVDGSTIIG